uniref:Uncharacterized protein n=1 Tax=Knipowitschia caucasica TaxID=637954 RepID=A0AAV2K8V6_KNICA
MPDAEAWGVARTLGVVKNGLVPVRVCNPHPYPVLIGRYQNLGKLYQVEEADVQGARDLSLTMGPDGVVEVGMVDTRSPERNPNEEVSKLIDSTCLTPQQQSELRSLLEKWMKVFASDEDFGRTDLVQHRIHTGEAPCCLGVIGRYSVGLCLLCTIDPVCFSSSILKQSSLFTNPVLFILSP